MKDVEALNVAERVREKAALRDADARALASGEVSRRDLQIENSAFAFPAARVRIDFARVRSKQPPHGQ